MKGSFAIVKGQAWACLCKSVGLAGLKTRGLVMEGAILSGNTMDPHIYHNLVDLHTIDFMATICRNCQSISISSKATKIT